MSDIKSFREIPVAELYLDPNNPRLPEGLRGASDRDVFNWMLDDATLTDLMASITENGYFPGEPIIVLEFEKDKYHVLEGNRRLAAVKLLENPKLATTSPITVQQLSNEAKESKTIPISLPAYIVKNRSSIAQYLGFRHVTGIKPWPLISKARFIFELYHAKKRTDSGVYKELAKEIGSKASYVRRLVIGYQTYLEIIKKKHTYGVENISESDFNLSLITDAITKYINIARYVNIDLDANEPLKDMNNEHFAQVVKWLYLPRWNDGSTLLGEGRNLTKLNAILKFEKATQMLVNGASIDDAIKYTDEDDSNFRIQLKIAFDALYHAQKLVKDVQTPSKMDKEQTEEVADMADSIRVQIKRKYRDLEL